MRTIFEKLRLILTIQCEQASQLTSEGLDRRLRRHERAALMMHRLLCHSCRQFAKQLRFLRQAVRELGRAEKDALDHGPRLDPAVKERLKQLRS